MNIQVNHNPFNSLTGLYNLVLNSLKALLLLRFFLKFFAANSTAPFAKFIYQTSEPLLALFGDVFPTRIIENKYVFEPTSILALVVVSIVGQIIFAVLDHTAFAHHQHLQQRKPTTADTQ